MYSYSVQNQSSEFEKRSPVTVTDSTTLEIGMYPSKKGSDLYAKAKAVNFAR